MVMSGWGGGWSLMGLMVLRWIQNWVPQLQTTAQLIEVCMSLKCIVQLKPWLASHICQFSQSTFTDSM